MAVALYARVSTTRQADNELSIPDQLRQMRDWCKANRHAIAVEYVEPGATATDDKRLAFQEMIAAAGRTPAPFDLIVVHSRSRFFRDLYEFLHYERMLKKFGVRIVSITQQTQDDAAGEMASKMFSMFDEYQSKENAKHTHRAMLENARQGYWNGSHPPYGYRSAATQTIGNRGRAKRRLEVDETEAEIVKTVYEYYLHGHDGSPMGMKAIASHLNAQGITMRGGPWRVQKVNKILSEPTYSGYFYFNRRDSRTLRIKPQSEWIAMEVPAIVSPALAEEVAAKREASNPKMHPPRALSSPAPLVGLLRCGHCGAGMAQATGKSGHYRYYKCTTRLSQGAQRCPGRNLPREHTDQLVYDALAERVFTPERVGTMLRELTVRQRSRATVENAKLLSLENELRSATDGLTRLYKAVEEGTLPSDDILRAQVQKLQARRDEAIMGMVKIKDRQTLALKKISQHKVRLFCQALKQRLKDSSTGFGKAYVRLLVDEVRLEGDQLLVRGSVRRLADAFGTLEGVTLGEVPRYISDWRARHDSNVRPLPSEFAEPH